VDKEVFVALFFARTMRRCAKGLACGIIFQLEKGILKMRKSTIQAAVAALAATFALGASAELKVATIDIEKIVDLHPDTARNRVDLKETLDDYRAEVDRLEDAAVAARKAAAASVEESRNPALGEKARKRAEEEATKNIEIARSAEREFAEKRIQRQRDLNEQEARMLRVTMRQIEAEIAKYAKEKGLSLVLPITGSHIGIAPAAIWADEALDITADIMAILGIEDREPETDDDKGDDKDKE
jgi:Skp family chaperone for outer membrane proteins